MVCNTRFQNKISPSETPKPNYIYFVWNAIVYVTYWFVSLIIQQQKVALMRNNSSVQNVTLRTKSENFSYKHINIHSQKSFSFSYSFFISFYCHILFACHSPFCCSPLLQLFSPQLQECVNVQNQLSILLTASDSPCLDPAVDAPVFACPRVSPPTTLQGEPHFLPEATTK